MHPRSALRSLVIVVAAAVLVAACGRDVEVTTDPPTDPPITTTGPAPGGHGAPTGADQLVVQVDGCCGFVPFEITLGSVPSLSIYGDGTAIVRALDAEGKTVLELPALPPLQVGRISDAEIARLLDLADRNHFLDGEVDFGSPAVTDVPSTTLTLVADGIRHEQSAYALSEEFKTGLTPAQLAARGRLRAFLDAARQAVRDASRTWVPARISVFAASVAEIDGGTPDSTKGPETRWPLDDPAAWPEGSHSGSYRCRTYEGGNVATVLTAARATTLATRWTAGGLPLQLIFRPLLPDEDDACGS